MKSFVSAMVVGLALNVCTSPALAGWNHQGNVRIVQLAQVLAQQAAGLAQQANAQAGGWGATWADRRAAQELSQFASDAQRLASSASGCMNGGGNHPGNPYPGNGNPYPYPGNGNPYPYPGNGNPPGNGYPYPGNGNPYPGQNPPGWPAPGHNNGGWNNGNNGGWNNGNNGGWNNGGGYNQDQYVGQQLERLFRDTWRQAGDVARTLGNAPRLRPLIPYWNQGVGSTLNQLRAAFGGSPYKRDSVREGLFSQLFGR